MSKFVSSPSFCYIAPTSYLQEYAATHSTTHLVLAHLVDEDPHYADFYQHLQATRGDYIMMDNSAYELKEPYAPEKLIELASKCGANAIVLPDYPFEPAAKTIEAAMEFAPKFKDAGFDTFFVPQSRRGETEDWISAYQWAASSDLIDIIGMSILGIPNALPRIDPSYARVVMTQLLQDRGVFARNKHHHYLGLNAGPALEIPSLLRMGALDTVDSSNPVWMAILGHEYNKNSDSYLSVRKVNTPVDFHAKRSKDAETHRRILANVQLTSELFTNRTENTTWFAQE